jgi:predicted HicB family RNase H-like nuclease
MHNKNYPSQTADKFMLRLPDGWRDLIKEHAARNRRSMNSEIVARLEQAFEQGQPTDA